VPLLKKSKALFEFTAPYATSRKQQSVLLLSGVASGRLHQPAIRQGAVHDIEL
jgi:hypothetical protein